ncbi:tRNA pseudouridine synthase 10 [Nematocida sp. AWRm80]|nr:tRNA pseudouridine synthase 10 [Nematocida sp. AWRm80]
MITNLIISTINNLINRYNVYKRYSISISDKYNSIIDINNNNIYSNTTITNSNQREYKEYLRDILKKNYNCREGNYKSNISIIIDKNKIEIEIVNDTIVIAGRYIKKERNISHTPFLPEQREIEQKKRRKRKENKVNKNKMRRVLPLTIEDGILKVYQIEDTEDIEEEDIEEECVNESRRLRAVSDWMKVFKEYFNGDSYSFISGGREDIDVRMLGRGRPFICKVENPKDNLPEEVNTLSVVVSDKNKEVEEVNSEYPKYNIKNRQSNSVELIETVLVKGPEAQKELKLSEELHSKRYRALVYTRAPLKQVHKSLTDTHWDRIEEDNKEIEEIECITRGTEDKDIIPEDTKEDISSLNRRIDSLIGNISTITPYNYNSIEYKYKYTLKNRLFLKQQTPIRVLHRRPNLTREKTIEECYIYANNSLEYLPVTGTLLELFLKSSSGTYIKEFVHGDFSRTHPSLTEIIGEYCDLIELDVLGIEDTFPSQSLIYSQIHLIESHEDSISEEETIC